MSQTTEILSWMENFPDHVLTPVEALNRFGSFRLSQRIREIESKGVQIERSWVVTPGGARVRGYRLAKEKAARAASPDALEVWV